MLIHARRLIGCKVYASDGIAGEIRSFIFDGRNWAVRYFVVRTGGLFSGKKVLVPPEAFSPRGNSWKNADVRRTKKQVESSPDLRVDFAVSRATAAGALDYAALPGYRAPGTKKGVISVINTTFGVSITMKQVPDAIYLYDAHDILHYRLKGIDGQRSALHDFIVDDRSWYLHYAVIGTGRWLSRRRTLLPVSLINAINEEDAVMTAPLSKGVLMKSPAYDPSRPLAPDYEGSLFNFYNRTIPPWEHWRFDHQVGAMPPGRKLRIEVLSPAVVRWSADNWKTVNETKTAYNGRGMHVAAMNAEDLRPGAAVQFTFFWLSVKRWEGRNYSVAVKAAAPGRPREVVRV